MQTIEVDEYRKAVADPVYESAVKRFRSELLAAHALPAAASEFDEGKFVLPGHEGSAGEWSDADRADIRVLRATYPELASWGDMAIGGAWGSYSQFELEVSWCDWLIGQRHDEFLAYIKAK
ncbi:hypothetical protein ACAX43_26590 [Paraburkholderia sp. IW21]|uniref:hypothetical protein n=1 Tax=Paraburkholderia sp. IW21 TaxID=3242488 RepID=UPI00352291A6